MVRKMLNRESGPKNTTIPARNSDFVGFPWKSRLRRVDSRTLKVNVFKDKENTRLTHPQNL